MPDEALLVYEIAFHLKMPVYQLVEEMPYEEFQNWIAYFDRRPVGWRDDDRVMKVLQTQGVKDKPWKIFGSLVPIYASNKPQLEEDQVDVQSLMGSSLFQKLITAKSGDVIPYEQN